MNEFISNSMNPNRVNFLNQRQVPETSVSGKNQAELKKVAEEFEAVFIAQLLKIMRETIEESGTEGSGFGKSVYTELFDQEIALAMARRGALGIGDIIYKSFAEEQEIAYGSEPVGTAQQGREAHRSAPEKSNKLP